METDLDRIKEITEEKPCPFLKDDGCEYPDLRPEDCVSFPHIQKEEFVYRSIEIVKNCSVCPIVFNVYERLKEEIWTGRNIRVDDLH